ncbi:3-dehydroquinate synthase [Ectothiorhodospiraceae bacterium BW-2]|nr:3-dehydroquinate synthase [Ectothiorhodospiraceae bacterium BW-2]
MERLTVDLGSRSYPIHIGAGLIDQSELFTPHIHGRQVLVVSNETVAPLYLQRLLNTLQGLSVASVVLPDGEPYKNLEVLNQIYDALLQLRFDRRCTLVALGGGVIGDMAGFAAATYQRGVNFIQVPTTLLSQVDSSVGGKTGVNHPLGKNMIGAFYQPQCVVADTETLNTLDDRQLSAGLAEVIKYGLINDWPFFEWLEQAMVSLRQRDSAALSYAIERSCRDKAAIVSADERESDQRALLNLGHTFGHAIETGMGYGEWLHGEAIGAGMVLAAKLSHTLGWIDAEAVGRVERLLTAAGVPTRPPPELTAGQFLQHMAVDKKVQDGQLRLVLMAQLGQAKIVTDIDTTLIRQVIGGC